MFHIARHGWQLILAVDLSAKAKEAYMGLKHANFTESITFVTATRVKLNSLIVEVRQFRGSIAINSCKEAGIWLNGILIKDVVASVKLVVKSRSLVSYHCDTSYSSRFMAFYLYDSKMEQNIDHIVSRATYSGSGSVGKGERSLHGS